MNKTKRLLISGLLLVSSVGLLGTGCSKEQESEVIESKCSIKLTKTLIDLNVGDSIILGATISGGSIEDKLVYKSNDESVITINEYGFIQALKPGRAEIKATYGTAIAKCSVNVGLNDNIPTIQLKNILDSSITIDKNTIIDLTSVINFNKQEYEFTPTYTLSNKKVAKMEGNNLVPLDNGTVYVTVSGKFFGTQAVSKTIEVLIKDNLVIYMKNQNDIETNDVYLYSVGELDDEVFVTEFTPSMFGVSINGEDIESPALKVDFIDEDGVVTFDPVTKKVSSTSKVGTAQYQVTYENANGEVFVKTFDVHNNKSVFTYKGGTLETDVFGYELPADDIFASFESKEILYITTEDGKTVYDAQDGIVSGLPFKLNDEGGVDPTNYIIYNNVVGFKVSMNVYSKIISTAEEMNFFNLADLTTKFSGYYVLANDIDGGGLPILDHTRTMGSAWNAHPNEGLLGTFDGRGHTLSGFSLGEGGLFGNIGTGGTVKNLGIENMSFRLVGGKDDIGILTCYMTGARIENVYINQKILKANYNAGLVATNVASSCIFNNCYFRCQIDTSQIVTKNFGVFGSMCGEKNGVVTGSFDNTYYNVVINANIPLVCSNTNSEKPYALVEIQDRNEDDFNQYFELTENGAYVLANSIEGNTFNVNTEYYIKSYPNKFIVELPDNPFVEEGNEFADFNFYQLNNSEIQRFYADDELSNLNFSNFSEEYWQFDGNTLVFGK